MESAPLTPASCSACQKPATQQCSRCRQATYCNRECQRAHWKNHKPLCKLLTSSPAPGTSTSNAPQTSFLQEISEKPLNHLPEREVYKRLIDSYRFRIEDEYVYRGEASGLYGNQDPLAGFRKFLNKAEKEGVLPPWWSKEKRAECERLGSAGGEDWWSNLNYAVEKADIQEHYGDSMMPMKLRVLAERILKSNVMEI